VIALARACRWKKLLDDGKFESVSDLAREIGIDVSFAARLLRLTRLAPDIIEAILAGEEPSGLSLTTLTKVKPLIWMEQMERTGMLGYVPANSSSSSKANAAFVSGPSMVSFQRKRVPSGDSPR
jgi:hypothetical protein